MEKYIIINGKRIDLTPDQVKQIKASFNAQNTTLSDVAAGDTANIGEHEFIVLEHFEDGTTAILRKDLLPDMEFGKTNNYDGSYVDKACDKFAGELAAIVGEENIVEHTVDLTSNDGLKDYGQIQRRVSLLTAERYRRYVRILDKFKADAYWWLATAFSTPRHDQDNWILCVSPSGCIYIGSHYNFDFGVRPFCILKSNIFVSK